MRCYLFAIAIFASSAHVSGDDGKGHEPARKTWAWRTSMWHNGELRQITITIALPPAPEDDKPPPARPGGPINIDAMALDRQNFDSWLFPAGYSGRERRLHLDEILEDQVEAAARKHKLTEAQRGKLRLAGRGDIKRFFDQVEDRRGAFEIDRQRFRTGVAALRRLDDLSHLYHVGPFGDGSLFAKALQKINRDVKAGPDKQAREGGSATKTRLGSTTGTKLGIEPPEP